MLIRNLYRHRVTVREEDRIDATLTVNPQHELFLGHFPGFALTPGVCQILMIREILEDELQMQLMLTTARQIKFTAVHEPGPDPEVKASISFSRNGNRLDVNASLSGKEKIFLKFRGEFRELR